MAKLTLNDIESLANTVSARQALNDNFAEVEEFANNTLSRDGSTPNHMEADIDLNGNDLLNVQRIDADEYYRDGIPLEQSVAYSNKLYQFFSGDGVEDDFTLAHHPGSIGNLEVSIAGAIKRPDLDFTYSGLTLHFLTPPSAGTNNILVRYDVAVQGLGDADTLAYTPPSTGTPGTVRSFLDLLWNTSGGASLVRFLHSGGSAVARTVQDKLRERVSVLDYIPVAQHAAIADGTTTYDATAAIQAAIDEAGTRGHVYFPAGVYKITAALEMSDQGVTLCGESRLSTIIRQDTMAENVLEVTGQYCRVRDIGITYGAGTPSGIAIESLGFFCHYSDIVIQRCGTGVKFSTGGGQKMTNFEVLEYESVGLLFTSVNDVFVSGFILNAGTQARGVLGGIRLTEMAEAIIVQNGDIISGKYSLTTDSAAYSAGSRPAYSNFTNVFCDSSAEGSIIENMVESEFIGCWFSGGRSGVGFAGLDIRQSNSLKFVNTRFFQNGAAGVLVDSTAKLVRFIGCTANSNSFTTGVGVSHGFHFVAGTSDFSLLGCTATNELGSGQQGYGIFIAAGASNQYVVADNYLVGNATGGMQDAGTGILKKVTGNIGFEVPVVAPTLAGTWVNFGAGQANSGYWKDGEGVVHLMGHVKDGTIGTTIFTLPVGYRPNASVQFPCVSNGAFGAISINSSGVVTAQAGNTAGVGLDGITFKVT